MKRQRPPICGVFTFMEKEIWKAITGYEGIYEVSTFGRVKSLSRKVCNHQGCHISKEIFLRSNINTNGYLQVVLIKDKCRKHIKVHKLIAIEFLNHKPCGFKLVVDHIDNNRLNNMLENLQLITARENASKDRKGGTSKYIGVSFYKSRNKWVSYIKVKNIQIFLGRFDIEIEASNAYQEALTRINNGLSAKVNK